MHLTIHAKVSGTVSQIFLQILNLTEKKTFNPKKEQGNRNPSNKAAGGARHDVNTIHIRVRTLPMVGTMFEYDTKRKSLAGIVYVASPSRIATNETF